MNVKLKAGLIIFAALLVIYTIGFQFWGTDSLLNILIVTICYVLSRLIINFTKKKFGLVK